MNKHSANKKRPAKASRSTAVRKASPRKSSARPAARKPAQNGSRKSNGHKIAVPATPPVAPPPVTQASIIHRSVSPGSTGANGAAKAHKFRVGQTVLYTSSPISRPGASGTYEVVRLLPSDGDDYQYRIKNPGEAFERVAKESQLELEG